MCIRDRSIHRQMPQNLRLITKPNGLAAIDGAVAKTTVPLNRELRTFPVFEVG